MGAVAAAAAEVGAAGAVVGAAAASVAGAAGAVVGAAGVDWLVHCVTSRLKTASALNTKEFFLEEVFLKGTFLFINFVSSLPRYSFECRKGLHLL